MIAMAKTILITGAAKRIGAACAVFLHKQGCNVILHYKNSEKEASQLCYSLNQQRANSAHSIQADLLDIHLLPQVAKQACQFFGGVDALVNNASIFYPQQVNDVTEKSWDDLIGSNLKAPFFLSQALMPTLVERKGCIVNIVDIHAERGLKDFPVYSISKAGLLGMTRVLAKEFAPNVRVNGISPGAILWPETDLSETDKLLIMDKIALKKSGQANDIAKTVAFLINDADYITGQIINVDGGRTLYC